ncbi:uncharacterized protein UDID_15050 [Ustilago sp. UG-2017a]|nr:uncharacterized protein UDID_15050 [Ustilago sp. UG-2017a]
MHSTPSTSAGSSSSPRRPELADKRRSVVALRSPSERPSSPLRVVHAEGSCFVLEPLPSRASPSASRSTPATRHVSAPHTSASTASTSSSSSSTFGTASCSSSPSQSRSVSSSLTPPRSKQTDRPYRPPPSSSARFYERQQQIWLLQQPSLLPPTPAAYVPSSSLHSPIAHHTAPASALPPLQPVSPPYTYAPDRERVPLSIRSRSSSLASSTSHSRAPSVSPLAPPEADGPENRARSASDASSFTRSRISKGYLSHTDDESIDHDSSQTPSAVGSLHALLQSSAPPPVTASFSYRHAALPAQQGSSPLHQSVTGTPQSPIRDSLGGSFDADWDAELGISEADHVEPLRLPLLQQTADRVLHPSPTFVDPSSTAKPAPICTKVVVSGASSLSTPVSTDSHLHSIQEVDLKGIRVTSSVSENWDDDFLFQNEEDTAASSSPSYGRTPPTISGGRSGANKQKRHSSHRGRDDDNDEDDDDVENWDDAFSWNADPHITPSASTSSSPHNTVQISNIPLAGALGHALHQDPSLSRELPVDVRRHLDFGRGADDLISKKRLSNTSTASGATDFSARLAAQFDADSDRQRPSFDSDEFFHPSLLPTPSHRNALGLTGASRRSRPSTSGRNEADGDDTETETPSKGAVCATKNRPARRSLGAALGFDTSHRSTADSATSSSSRTDDKKKDEAVDSAEKTHKRSKSKLGALQRLSFSRSRINVANASSISVNVPNGNESAGGVYANGMNKSQASLVSQMSSTSNRSRRAASPSSLEKSYTALRSTSFRRLLGRGGQTRTTSPNALATPSSSPPRRTSELVQPLDAFCSPVRDSLTSQTAKPPLSPPFAWLGLRRSSEATPTHSKEQSSRRGSDNAPRDSSERLSWAVPGSPSKPSISLEGRTQRDARAMPSVQACLQSPDPSGSVPSWQDVSSPSKGLAYPPTSNLRRDFSSSNTLRAAMAQDNEDRADPTQHRHGASRTETSVRTLQPSYREVHSRNASYEATADGPTSAQYPYLGQRVLHGSNGNAYASRSVSASTAHSQTSTDSLSGYRMRKQISASSGHNAHDSEASYRTSVGSSPGLSSLSSSGWLSHGKRGATSSFDTKDTAWSAAVMSSAHHGSLRAHSDQHSGAASMPGSPINLKKTLEETPATAPRTARMLSAPDTSLSPSRQSQQGGTSYTESPMTPSRGVRLAAIESSPVKPPASAADTSAPILASANLSASSTASLQKSATRRNSLSDLKIPSRISKAQTGLRNNISLVRDFAKGIEELKMLKSSYLDHRMRAPLSSADVEDRMQNWLECADVLIGLGEGRTEADSAARVDTVSHTPLTTRVDSRRTTFSDVSSYASPRSPLGGLASSQSSISGARSTSGTSQATTSTTDGVRSVDVQREIDILSAILGPTSHVESRYHGRFQSEQYSRDEVLHRSAESLKAPRSSARAGSSTNTDIQWSNLTIPSRVSFDEEKRNARSNRTKNSERAFNTVPVHGALSEVAPLEGVDVGGVDRSAKRRLRSASRAGLQGLRDLLKVFKGAETASSVPGIKATESSPSKEEPRTSVDISNPCTPAKRQKRKSLNLKRRSFLRSKTSLDNLESKDTNAAAQEVTPPMPSIPLTTVAGNRKQPSPGKVSLDTTWEVVAAKAGEEKQRKESRAGRRISLQSALSGKRRSVDGGATSTQGGQRVVQSAKVEGGRHVRRPSLAVHPPTQGEDAGRGASTSVDTTYQSHPPNNADRSQSSLEAPKLSTSGTVQKLALRPEAMPGLLVYVQATKQHLIAAIEEFGPAASVMACNDNTIF